MRKAASTRSQLKKICLQNFKTVKNTFKIACHFFQIEKVKGYYHNLFEIMFSNNIKHHIKNEVIGFDQHVVGSPPTPPIKPSRLSNSGIPVFVITDNQEVFLCPVCNIEILKSNLNWHIQTMHQVEVQTKILEYNDPDVQEAEENDLKTYNIAGKDFKFNKTRPPAMNGGYIVS